MSHRVIGGYLYCYSWRQEAFVHHYHSWKWEGWRPPPLPPSWSYSTFWLNSCVTFALLRCPFLFLVYCIFFVIGLVGLCCKPQPLVIIIIITISCTRTASSLDVDIDPVIKLTVRGLNWWWANAELLMDDIVQWQLVICSDDFLFNTKCCVVTKHAVC